MKTLRSRLLPGVPLLGFATAFDAASGDPETPWPYAVVTPSAVGPALLPFACPHCGASCGALVDPDRRAHYHDRLRKFSWCPACRGRFFVDRKGRPLTAALPAGAEVAPAEVSRPGEVPAEATESAALSAPEVGVLHLLGAG